MGWRQLCAVAEDQQHPEIVEWVERIKDRILALSYTYPSEPDAIHRAMRAVEASYDRRSAFRG